MMLNFQWPTSEENSDSTSNETTRNASVCSSDKQGNESHDGTSQKTMVPIQQQHQLQQQSPLATTQSLPQHHNNIILVRGARTENGQIILQNSHELLNLLNDEDKPILLQHPRFKTSKQQTEGAILLQPTLKGAHIDGPVLLQSASVKKSTTLPEGSIIVQQRLNKNGTADGPILLQTLKRLDKSQSILVFRNANGSTASSSLTSNSTNSRLKNVSDDAEEKKPDPIPVPKAINTPLGSEGICMCCDSDDVISDEGMSLSVEHVWPSPLLDPTELFMDVVEEDGSAISMSHPMIYSFQNRLDELDISSKSKPRAALVVNLPLTVQRELGTFKKQALKCGDT
ncbi:hypothetical protein Bhyg_07110 [Pseudolycoriella hygida]|uniref:Uncharacterized protein n=1 Tax=Pseudolycoriella hygida TaxID=35572 RepID=A0A9Q0S331_9DIPT|nr:hypothetical protein Bhyg_07110 [Pseudolycoriella hygida]